MELKLRIIGWLGCAAAMGLLTTSPLFAQSRKRIPVGKPRFQISGQSPTTSPGLEKRGSSKIPVGRPRTSGSGIPRSGSSTRHGHGNSHHGHHDHHHGHHHHHGYRYRYPLTYPYVYSPYSYYGPGYYYSFNSYYDWGPYWLPPIVIPSGGIYGPGPVQRQLGMARDVPAAPVDPQPDLILRNNAGAGAAPVDPPRARERAWRSVDFGDARFADKNFHGALQRYKEATGMAPNLGDTYFRQGFAYMALGMYPRAFSSFQRGLKLKPGWAESNFRIDELYGDLAADKAKHLRTLSAAANDRSTDAKLWFLIGVALHFDGQKDRAQLFFQRAADLDPQMPELHGFMPEGEAKRPRGVEF